MSKQEPNKDIAQQERGAVSYTSRDGQQVKLSFDTIRKYLISGKPELVTDQELMLFMGICKARGLNPFKKDVYLIKFTPNDPAATIVSIDYFRSRAKAQPDCRGWQSGVIVRDKDGAIVFRKGSLLYEGDTLLGGWFRARPEGWNEEYEWTVSLQAYIKKTSDGRITRFWATENQPAQIAKVAESQGLRRLWPDEFQGLNLEGDEVIDVTPPEPIRTPKAINVKAPQEYKADASTRSNAAGNREATRPSPSDVPASVSTAESTAESGDSPLSKEDIAILKIDSYTADNWPEAKELNPLMKELDMAAQLRVAQHFDRRKKEVLGV